MAKTVIPLGHNGENFSASGSTTVSRYTSLVGALRSPSQSAAFAESVFRSSIGVAGTLSLLSVMLSANAYAASKAVFVRVNAADVTQTITIGAGATGHFQDATHTDAIAVGDLVALRVAPNFTLSSWTLQTTCIQFDGASSATAMFWGSGDSALGVQINGGAGASTTRYVPIAGVGDNSAGWFTTAEANAKTLCKTAGTFNRLGLTVQSNTSTNNATVTFRKNGASGSQVLTLTAGATGLFEDTTHTDAVVAGDDVNLMSVTGAGTVSCVVQPVSISFASAGTGFDVRWACTRTAATGFSLGDNFATLNGFGAFTTESLVETKVPLALYMHNLVMRIASTTAGVTTASTRINGAGGTLTCANPSGTTGSFEDTTHVDTVAANDLVNYKLNCGTTTVAVRYLGVTMNTANPAATGDAVLRYVVA